MATNTNIKLTADVKAFRQSFGEAAGAVKSFTSDFERRASDVEKIGGRIATASKNLNLSTDTRKFAGGITSTFESLNRELNVATGREQLFGASLDSSRAKLNAYQGALNSLLGLGMKPTEAEARNLTAEIKRLNAEVDSFKPQKIARPAGGMNVAGNLGSVLAGQVGGGTLGAIGGAFGMAGAAIGTVADKLIDLTRAISKVTDEYEGYRLVLNNITGSQLAAGNAFDFAVDKANEAGFQIGTVEQSYKSFIGSGKMAGLSLTQLNAIFQGATRYGASYKLSNDQISGSLLALGQMLSKSNVQAEELRGQLGERMPGAYSLFAKAMGVSEQQLGKMLEKGQILAKDALPKFAAELEKASSGNYAKNLDTVSGSFNVLQNNINLLMDAFGRSTEVNSFFSSINKGLSNTVANLTALVNSGEWSSFFLALTGNQAAMGKGAVERTFQGRKGFSQMGEGTRNQKIYEQIALVSRLETNLNNLSKVYSKTGQKEAEYFQARANVDKAKKFLDSLVKIDAELSKADRPAKSNNTPAGATDPKALDKLIKSMIDQSNDRIADGLRDVQMNSFNSALEALSKESKLAPLPAKLYIAPAFEFASVTGTDLKGFSGGSLLQSQINKLTSKPISVSPTAVDRTIGAGAGADIESYFQNLGGIWESNAAEFGDMAGVALGNALGAGFSKMGTAIAQGENPFKAFGEGILQSFGDMLMQVGQKMLAEAGAMLAASILTGGAVAPIAYRTLALGTGLTIAGGAMKAVKLADGGILNKSTFANMGEYGNARTNPEIAAPLDRLTGIMRKALLPDIKAAASLRTSSQPIYITTINTTDGREVSRSTKRYDTKRGYVIP